MTPWEEGFCIGAIRGLSSGVYLEQLLTTGGSTSDCVPEGMSFVDILPKVVNRVRTWPDDLLKHNGDMVILSALSREFPCPPDDSGTRDSDSENKNSMHAILKLMDEHIKLLKDFK